MDKILSVNIDENQLSKVMLPIRNKKDALLIIFEVMKWFLIGDATNPCGTAHLVIDKMSRVFLTGANKMYSVFFPFNLYFSDNEQDRSITFRDLDFGLEIDQIMISIFITLLNQNIDNTIEDFYETLLMYEESREQRYDANNIWKLYHNLISYEMGYIRYDVDEARINGKIHPKFHFDINYSNKTTYKIGINQYIDIERFIDILNVRTNCVYLEK